jgi:hypothetical protein
MTALHTSHPYTSKSSFASARPSARVMQITPGLASEMLATSSGNRKIRQWWVKWLASAISRNEMRVTSQGIGFDVTGSLRDGHHRLEAVVASGLPIETVVVYGMRIDAYRVIDIGVKRSVADRINTSKSVAQIIKLGCQYALSEYFPSTEQMQPYMDAGFLDIACEISNIAATNRRYYSSAPMKLAACVTIMDGGDANFVTEQIRALCAFDINSMSEATKALVRQVENDNVKSTDTEDVLARGLRVFDKRRSGLSKIQINKDHAIEARRYVAQVLNDAKEANAGGAA